MKKKNTKPFDSAAVMRLLKIYEYVMYLDADIIIGNLCKSLKPLIGGRRNIDATKLLKGLEIQVDAILVFIVEG